MAAVMIGLLVVFTIASVSCSRKHFCPRRLFQHPSLNETCCQMCPPGTHVHQLCTDVVGTQCRRCQDGLFQSSFTSDRSCKRCSACDRNKVVASNCTVTADVSCECQDGFKMISSGIGAHCSLVETKSKDNMSDYKNCSSCANLEERVRELTSIILMLSGGLVVILGITIVFTFVHIGKRCCYRHKAKRSRSSQLTMDALLSNASRSNYEENWAAADDSVLLRNVPHLEKLRIISYLTAGGGWKIIAGEFGYNSIDIGNWETRPQDAAGSFIFDLETRNTTVLRFCQILMKRERHDCIAILRGYLFPEN